MSGADYTRTPRLGLYKPNYALDVGQWGAHLNLNSDTLDAAWASDVINVLDKGADPTGVADSAPAFNAAAAEIAAGTRRRAVYFPTGTYRINSQINLTAAQAFYGDSRGSSVLMVDDQFDPAATSVISVTASFYDPGPVLRDFGITFVQPTDQTARANFKTLAEGGTSHPGGTGVKYPWAIASGSNGFRVQVVRVRIGGAWDGITSNGFNTVFWLDDIEMGALDCGLSLGEGAAGIQDFCHVSSYHFWGFEISGTTYSGVYADGQTIAMRVGRADGLNIKAFCTFLARLVVTPDAAGFTAMHITNCMLDGDQAAIEINGQCLHINIANVYGTAGTSRIRPLITMAAGGALNINNYYAHSSSNYSDILVNDPSAVVTVSNFKALFNSNNTRWAEVQQGMLRLGNGYLELSGPRTVPAIAETASGTLIVDNVAVQAASASGPLLSVVTVSPHTMIGRISVQAGAAWTNTLPAGLSQTFLGNVRVQTSPTATAAQLVLSNAGGANGLESKLRFHGSFPTGTDQGEYLAASLRAGWSATAWSGSYLNVWLTNAGNGASDDVNMIRAATFTPTGLNNTPIGVDTQSSGSFASVQSTTFGLNAPPKARITVSGAKAGNAALTSLIAAMTSFGLITDSTT